jgi:hypothetical protein
VAGGAEILGEFGEPARRLLGDGLAGEPGLQPVRLGERPFQLLARRWLAQLVERDVVAPGDRVGPVGDDPEPVEVGDNQERRVLERQGIALELVQRVVEALALALVLPAEAAALPDVGPAFPARGLGGPLLEAVPFAPGVGVGRLGLVQELA